MVHYGVGKMKKLREWDNAYVPEGEPRESIYAIKAQIEKLRATKKAVPIGNIFRMRHWDYYNEGDAKSYRERHRTSGQKKPAK
jgi:hypothetical protein